MGFPILSVIVYIPLLTALIILFLRNHGAIRMAAALGGALTFIVSLVAFGFYAYYKWGSSGPDSFDLRERYEWLPDLQISYHMGVDAVAMLLIVLTTLLSLISIVISFDPIQKRVKEYYITLLFLEVGMLGVFVSLDFFLFYIFWEVMLVPMALLIGIWGSSNRVYAAVKFFLYTLAGSLLMLVAIIALYLQN